MTIIINVYELYLAHVSCFKDFAVTFSLPEVYAAICNCCAAWAFSTACLNYTGNFYKIESEIVILFL